MELFLERGFHETTVSDITDAAGVSQRTFFRYFPTKDAVLLTEHARREAEMRELLASRAGQPVRETLDLVLAALTEDVDSRRDLVQVQTRVFFVVSSMANHFAGHHERLSTIVAEHLAQELGVSVDADPRPRMLASQVTRAFTSSVLMWIVGDMTGDLPAMAADVLRQARTDPLFQD